MGQSCPGKDQHCRSQASEVTCKAKASGAFQPSEELITRGWVLEGELSQPDPLASIPAEVCLHLGWA